MCRRSQMTSVKILNYQPNTKLCGYKPGFITLDMIIYDSYFGSCGRDSSFMQKTELKSQMLWFVIHTKRFYYDSTYLILNRDNGDEDEVIKLQTWSEVSVKLSVLVSTISVSNWKNGQRV